MGPGATPGLDEEPDPSEKERAEGDPDEPRPNEQGRGTPGFDPADEERAEGDP